MERFTPHLPLKFYYLFLSFFQMDGSMIEHTLSNYLHVLRFISYHSKVHWDSILQTPISNSHINLQNNNQNQTKQNKENPDHSTQIDSPKL